MCRLCVDVHTVSHTYARGAQFKFSSHPSLTPPLLQHLTYSLFVSHLSSHTPSIPPVLVLLSFSLSTRPPFFSVSNWILFSGSYMCLSLVFVSHTPFSRSLSSSVSLSCLHLVLRYACFAPWCLSCNYLMPFTSLTSWAGASYALCQLINVNMKPNLSLFTLLIHVPGPTVKDERKGMLL